MIIPTKTILKLCTNNYFLKRLWNSLLGTQMVVETIARFTRKIV